MKFKAKAQMEAATEAWKACQDYLDTKGVSADKLDGADVDEFASLFKAAEEADLAWQRAEALMGGGATVRERLDFYSTAITGKGMGFHPVATVDGAQPNLGRQFIESDGYKNLVKSGVLRSESASFRSEPVIEQKATTDLIDTVPGGPASALVLPQYLPGILPYAQRDLVVRDLFSQGTTTSDVISYARQTGFDSGAAAVSQATAVNGSGVTGGVKPQSSISWTRETSPVETIATWMVTTRQALADAGQVEALINNQGRIMLQLAEEEELLNGDGTAPNLEGILTIPEVQILDLTNWDNLDGIRTAIRMIRTGSAKARADGIVLNPIDSEEVDLLKDDNGLYRGGNPIGNFNFGQSIWRLNRVESEAIDEGTALVGAFRFGATVLERQPITVYTADQHSDFFIRNLIVILFEERLGFPVFFPTAFVKVTLNEWTRVSGT